MSLNAIRKITGTDGISPTVTTSKSDGVTTVTITDKDGAHTATIADGATGAKGDKGDTGADGYSPTATVTKSGTTTTVTVTDKSGTTTAEVKDGSDAAVTKDNIVSALGYEPEKPEGFELIRNLTLTEDTYQLEITEDENGNAFTLKRFVAMILLPTNDYDFSIYVGVARYRWVAYVYAKGFRRLIFDVYPFGDGYWQCTGDRVTSASENSYSYNATSVTKDTVKFSDIGTTTSAVALQGASESKPIKSGTTVKIYGIRA